MCDADLTEEFNFLYSPLFVNLYLLSLTMGGSCFPHFLNKVVLELRHKIACNNFKTIWNE